MIMFGTPDFGQSDLWHQNFAFKFLLSEALKLGYFPLWSKDIGMGFPLLGEGQIGMFYLPNIILFRLFDPVLAFNLSYVFIFLTTFIGSYLFGRTIKLKKISSIFLAYIFTFSGVMITHVPHINLIQVVSWIPWQFYLIEKLIKTEEKRFMFGIAFALSFQLYACYQQIVLISLMCSGLYFLFRVKQEKKVRIIFKYLLAILFGILVSLPQLLPSMELLKLSFRDAGTAIREIARFPYHPKNLLSFLNPYWFGDPRIGTYPPFSNDWGIFWESTGYIGLMPLIIAIGALVLKQKIKLIKFLSAILILFIILFLGRYTPFFFVFQILPFSLFRVPSRFLIAFVWFLAIAAAIGINKVKYNFLVLLIILISFLDLGNFAVRYNSVISSEKWLAEPEVISVLKKDKDWFRVYCQRPIDNWNEVLNARGWKDMDRYITFRNCLDPNQNLIWSISTVEARSGILSRRQRVWQNTLDNATTLDRSNGYEKISSSGAKLLFLSGIKYYISPNILVPTDGNNRLNVVATISGNPVFTVYSLDKTQPHAWLTNNYSVATTVLEAMEKISSPSAKQVVVEENIPVELGTYDDIAVVTKNSDLEMRIAANAKEKSLLILADTYYPGWKATIDNISVKIYPVNLIFRAVIFPVGKHEVIFKYEPLKVF